MSGVAQPRLGRRRFLQASAGAGGAFLLYLGSRSFDRQSRVAGPADVEGAFTANAFITITPDNRILFACPKSEMGQGVETSYCQFVAEELGVPIDFVESYFAPGAPEYRTGYNVQVTGGSTSVPEGFLLVRQMAASAREMLIGAAAAEWGVRPDDCRIEGAAVVASDGRQSTFAALGPAAARQPVPSSPRLKSASEFRVVGRPVRRVDNVPKVTGTARFGLDVQVAGMVKAWIIHPPMHQGRVRSFDATAARQQTGVLDVVQFESGIAVVAEKIWQAQRAAALVTVNWENGPANGFSTASLFEELRSLSDGPGSIGRDDGDVDEALATPGAKVLEGLYTAPLLAHATMEPQNATAHVREDVIEIWAPVQGPTMVQEVVGAVMGYERNDVIVHPTYLGGGFGRRSAPDLCVEAARLSGMLGRPVQVVWSREDDTRGDYYRPASVTTMRGAVSADGRPLAVSYHTVCQPLARDFRSFFGSMMPDPLPPAVRSALSGFLGRVMSSGLAGPDLFTVEGARGFPYAVPSVRVAHTPFTTPFTMWPWRSVGHSFNGFVMEGFVNEMADACGEDPFEFRRAHLPEGSRLRTVLERAAELGRWGHPTPGWHQGIACHEAFGGYCAQIIEARIDNGQLRVGRVSAAADVGLVVNPDQLEAQVQSAVVFGLSAALYQQLDVIDGRVQQANFDTYPALRMHECGDIDVAIIDSGESPAGGGEMGLPPTAPALAGAIFAATGTFVRSMPFVPALQALGLIR
jgi:CO/xanthine dehydrogenase Mo-binding subunit